MALAVGDGQRLLDLGELRASDDEQPLFRLTQVQQPVLSVTDLGFLRGDGVFEAATVANGRAVALAYHLRRLDRSLRLLELPPLRTIAVWREAIELFLEQAGVAADEHWFLRILISRGVEQPTAADRRVPTILLLASQSPGPRDLAGVRAILLSREIHSESARNAPWLLLGAKTLSYASNMAINRHTAARGAELAILHTVDGKVLEGPNSSILLRLGDTFVTPDPVIGILHGTTQAEFFRYAQQRGFETRYAQLPITELFAADAVYTLGGGGIRPVVRIEDARLDADWKTVHCFTEFLRAESTYQSDWQAAASGSFPAGPGAAAE